jgi:hypothetical protein
MNKSPKESSSQEIGRLAVRAISSKFPTSWIDIPQSGDSDFGIDYLIQLKDTHGFVNYSFYLQLKGTTVPEYISNGEFISFSFKTSTLAYYYSQEPLVMVALVDLKNHEDDVSKCPIYYMWLDNEWFDSNKEKIELQDSLSLNIPTKQLLDGKLDIYDFYKKRINEKFAMLDLRKSIKPLSEDVSRAIGKVSKYISDKPIILKAVEESGDEPWLSNPEGQATTLLKKCSDALENNFISKAKEILTSLENWPAQLSQHEFAELNFQRSALCTLLGKNDDALTFMERSLSYSDKPRYKLSLLEEKIKNNVSLSETELESIEPEISRGEFRAVFIKAKSLAISGNLKRAIDIMRESHNEKVTARLILLTLAEDPQELDDELNMVNPDGLTSDREKYVFYALFARREFFKAHGGKIDYDKVLPFNGRSNLNIDNMKRAYHFCDNAWKNAKKLGYPADFLILTDISPLIYFYFNNIGDLFNHFEKILEERPSHVELSKLYSRLQYNCNNFDRVIGLLSAIEEDQDLDDKSLLFSANVYLNNYEVALDVFLNIETELLDKHPENTPFILCLAIEVALANFDDILADRLKFILMGFESGEAFLAVSTCVRDIREKKGSISECLEILYQRYIELEKPMVIAEHLLRFLNVREDQAEYKIIETSERILLDKELDESCSIKLAEAYLKLKDVDKVLAVVDKNLEKIKTDPHWHVIKTYAFQLSGKIGEALNEIEQTLKSKDYSTEHLKLYVNMCLAFGMLSHVESALQRLLYSNCTRKEKLFYYSKLIAIYSSDLTYKDKLISSIKRFGELVDRDDSNEEGQYLFFILMTSIEMNDGEKANYEARLSEYVKKFPKSNTIRKTNIDIKNGPEALLNSIRELTGVTDEQIAQWEKNKRAIKNGTMPIPFAMLGQFLSDTRDIFTSWMLANNTPEESLEFKIIQAPQSVQKTFDEHMHKKSNILIEETSLILMHDLHILDEFLDRTGEFIILNSCFERLNNSNNFLRSEWNNLTPQKILQTINKHRAKLRIYNDEYSSPFDSYHDIFNSTEICFLTDDYNMLMLSKLNKDKVFSSNIYNVISFLNGCGVINESDFYNLITKVSTFGFKSINMDTELMASAYVYYLNGAKDQDYTNTNFKYLFDNVFNTRRKFEEVIGVFYKMLSYSIDVKSIQINANALLPLFTNFLIRYPKGGKVDFILNWFVYQCINGKEEYISDLLPISIPHSTLWNVCYEMCCMVTDTELKNVELFKIISTLILNEKLEIRENIFNKVIKCFIPATSNYDDFSSVYKAMSMQKRFTESHI